MKLTKWGKEHYTAPDRKHTLCGRDIPPGTRETGADGKECAQCVRIAYPNHQDRVARYRTSRETP